MMKAGSLTVAVLGVALVLLYGAGIDNEPGPYGDNGIYLILAQSIRTTGTYTNLEVPGRPAHLQNPPLFPLMISPFARSARPSHTVLQTKIVVMLLALIAVALYLRWASDRMAPTLAALSATALALCPLYYEYAHAVMSEIPALLLTLLALMAVDRYASARKTVGRDLLMAGLLIAAAGLTRTICWVLAPAAVAALLCNRRNLFTARLGQCVALAIVCAVPLGSWELRNSLAKQEQKDPPAAYFESLFMVDPEDESLGTIDFAGLRDRVADNLAAHSNNLATTLLPKLPDIAKQIRPTMQHPIGILTGILLVASVAVRLLKKREVAEWYLLFFGLVLLVWPWNGSRFLVPILPLLWFHLFGALGAIGQFVRVPRALPSLALVIILLGSSIVIGRSIYATRIGDYDLKWGEGWTNLRTMAEYAAIKGNPRTVLMCRKPGLAYWWTGSLAVLVPYTNDPEVYWDTIDRYRVDYLIVDRVGPRVTDQAETALRFNPNRLTKVAYPGSDRPGAGSLYRVEHRSKND